MLSYHQNSKTGHYFLMADSSRYPIIYDVEHTPIIDIDDNDTIRVIIV